jgi:hypothetical protein
MRYMALLLVALLFGVGESYSAELLVPEDHATIAGALEAAVFGDTVSIATGTYYEHDLVWPPGVSILGRAGDPDWVVIDAQYQGRVLGGEDLVPQNELGFLTLKNGDAEGWPGSGLSAEGDAYLHDFIVEHCRSSHRGIGLYVRGGATITDCVLRYNQTDASSTSGGGAWLQDRGHAHPLYVRKLEVHGNDAEYGAGIYYNGFNGYLTELYIHDNPGPGMTVLNGEVDGIGPTVENSLFENNLVCGVGFDAGLILRNCTFVGNGIPDWWVGAITCLSTWDHPMDPRLTQCIVAFNHGPGITRWEPTPFTIDCNDVFDNAGGNYTGLPDLTGQYGNISLDPRFCVQGSIPYGLHADSPCAPENNDCGLLMGAFPVSCAGTSTSTLSWSAVKALY